MKKTLALILALVMVFALIPAISLADDPVLTDIKDVRTALAAGTTGVEYTVKGIVTYVYSNKEIYIQDAEGYGICVYLKDANTDVTVGKELVATGTSKMYGKNDVTLLPELNDAVVVSTAEATAIVAAETTLADIVADYDKYLCTLVSFTATIASYDSYSNPTLTDGTNSLVAYRVTLDPTTLPVGTEVEATLVLSAYTSYQFRGEPSWITAVVTEPEEPELDPTDLVILSTNDVHTKIDNYSKVAYILKAQEALYNNVVMVDAGDYLQGTAYGVLSQGAIAIAIMNEVGYDVVTLGNHEFDYGMDVLFTRMEELNADAVSSNFIDLATGNPVYPGYVIKDYAGVKVAFVGITTPESYTKSTPAFFQDSEGNYIYGFCEGNNGQDLYDNVQASVDAAIAEGADYVIALGHLGIDEGSAPWTSTELIANTNGIDVFIDGHSHSKVNDEVKNKDSENVVLLQTGTQAANVGKVTITAEGAITAELIATGDSDEETAAFIAEQKAPYEEKLNEVVAHTNYKLVVNDPATGNRLIRKQETNLGDLCADAYKDLFDSDIAFVNGGGIRVDIGPGELTINDLLSVHPFGNSAVMIEATGREILDALEMGCDVLPNKEDGGFMHVAGLTYEIHTYMATNVVKDDKGNYTGVVSEELSAYRVQNVKVLNKETGKYEALDLEKVYKVGGHNYMLQDGGDGYAMFADNTVLSMPGVVDYEVLQRYIVDTLKGEIPAEYANPYGQGRIVIVAEGEEVPETKTDYWFDAPEIVAGDNMVDIYKVVTTVDGDEYTKFTVVAAGSEAPAAGENKVVTKVGENLLRYDIAINDLPEGYGLTSAELYLQFDETCLEYVGCGQDYGIYSCKLGDAKKDWSVNITDGNVLRAAIASDNHLTATNPIFTAFFKIKDGVENGTVADMKFIEIEEKDASGNVINTLRPGISVTDANEAKVEGFTFAAYDGTVTFGEIVTPVDKTLLQNLYNTNKAENEKATFIGDKGNAPAGSMYLTKAEKDNNDKLLTAALAVLENENATQAEVDKAYENLLYGFVAPRTAVVDTTELEAQIAAADEKMASDAWAGYSDGFKTKFKAAYDAAVAVRDDAEHTQNEVDAAAAKLAALNKTGESTIIFVFAGVAILAMLGLAIVAIRRRRFN